MKRLFLLLLCAAFAMVGCEELMDFVDYVKEYEKPVFQIQKRDYHDISELGETIEVSITTNQEYIVAIPDDAKFWVRHIDTRATRAEVLVFEVSPNQSEVARTAVVDLLSPEREFLASITIVQRAGSEVSDLVLMADKTDVIVGEEVTFVVYNEQGINITDKAQIYDNNLEAIQGTKITFQSVGVYRFLAVYGELISEELLIKVHSYMPKLPKDHDPSNLAFHHRPLVIRYAGVNCGYCPIAQDELLKLSTSEYGEWFNEVDSHAGSYASGDPANSEAANVLHAFQKDLVLWYPTIVINFYNRLNDYFYASVVSALEGVYKGSGADVGISMAVAKSAESVLCSAQIKSAKSVEYRVNAWLLENDIYSPRQAGVTKESHKIYNHALRNVSESVSKTDFAGAYVGVIEKGEMCDYSCEIPILSNKWNIDNMEVLLVVSALDESGEWDVVNTARCPINTSISYRYIGENELINDVEF